MLDFSSGVIVINTENNKRLLYIDNLRLLMIILVVASHAAVTYNGFGNWYYLEQGERGLVQTAIMGLFQAFTQSYYMGFLFLIAGYFVPSSYDKRGFAGFLAERFTRLIIPTILYLLIVDPFIHIVLLGTYALSAADYFGNLFVFDRISSLGPMWFTLALFIFSAAYAGLRKILPATSKKLAFPKTAHILVFAPVLGICVFASRLLFPISANFFNMRLGFFAQYIVMFALGIKCRRYGWFEKMSFQKHFLWIGLFAGAGTWLLIMVLGLDLHTTPARWSVFHGGMSWQSAVYSLWESFVALFMSVGLLAVFKEKCNVQGRIAGAMSRNSFFVYFSHSIVLTALALLFRNIDIMPVFKFLLLTAAGIPASFLFANLLIRPAHDLFLLLARRIRVTINTTFGGRHL